MKYSFINLTFNGHTKSKMNREGSGPTILQRIEITENRQTKIFLRAAVVCKKGDGTFKKKDYVEQALVRVIVCAAPVF